MEHQPPGIGEGSKVEPYIMNYQQVQDNGSYNMFGCRADLKRNSILFEGEFAMQSSRRIKANILSLNLGYKADQFNWLKSLTAGLDIVSGDDPGTDDLEGFSKYFGARQNTMDIMTTARIKDISGTHMKDFRN